MQRYLQLPIGRYIFYIALWQILLQCQYQNIATTQILYRIMKMFIESNAYERSTSTVVLGPARPFLLSACFYPMLRVGLNDSLQINLYICATSTVEFRPAMQYHLVWSDDPPFSTEEYQTSFFHSGDPDVISIVCVCICICHELWVSVTQLIRYSAVNTVPPVNDALPKFQKITVTL